LPSRTLTDDRWRRILAKEEERKPQPRSFHFVIAFTGAFFYYTISLKEWRSVLDHPLTSRMASPFISR
jgi:hypothetical protein